MLHVILYFGISSVISSLFDKVFVNTVLCKTWGFVGDHYSSDILLDCDTV